jgi:hypothetical protein
VTVEPMASVPASASEPSQPEPAGAGGVGGGDGGGGVTAPLPARFTTPPRPPSEAAPPPCATGKAAGDATRGGGVGSGVGVGTGGGGGVGGGSGGVDVPAGQFDTVIIGTVPADENATAPPAGASTCIGTVKLITPLVVDVALSCASISAGVAQIKANRKLSLLDMIIAFRIPSIRVLIRLDRLPLSEARIRS